MNESLSYRRSKAERALRDATNQEQRQAEEKRLMDDVSVLEKDLIERVRR